MRGAEGERRLSASSFSLRIADGPASPRALTSGGLPAVAGIRRVLRVNLPNDSFCLFDFSPGGAGGWAMKRLATPCRLVQIDARRQWAFQGPKCDLCSFAFVKGRGYARPR